MPAGSTTISNRKRRSAERSAQRPTLTTAALMGSFVAMVILGSVLLACGWPPSAATPQHTQVDIEFMEALTGVASPPVQLSIRLALQQGPGTLVPHRGSYHSDTMVQPRWLTAGMPQQPPLQSPPKSLYDNLNFDSINYYLINNFSASHLSNCCSFQWRTQRSSSSSSPRMESTQLQRFDRTEFVLVHAWTNSS